MKPYYQDLHNTLYAKDCRQMTELADNSVQCVVTSPPYWGLRKYSGEQELIWGEKGGCKHQWQTITNKNPLDRGGKGQFDGNAIGTNMGTDITMQPIESGFCSLCGAWKGAYGLEPTPEMYVQHTIEILREIRRVLRKDGVVFWNIGDSYMSHAGDRAKVGGFQANPNKDRLEAESSMSMVKRTTAVLKDKDLCLIPFRVAIAAQEDGWWVRSIIIWSKPNPMPESVTDRPTESHEYILMLTKSARYYYDQEAVREKYTEPLNRWGGNDVRNTSHKWIDTYEQGGDNAGIGAFGKTSMLRAGAVTRPDEAGRNLRSVWEFPTQPYPEAHFAVFPEKLPEICIKAATPEEGCCSKCGAPWERITKRMGESADKTLGKHAEEMARLGRTDKSRAGGYHGEVTYKTTGWQPTCKCNADKVPSIVLDPFAGAGTTLWVAKKLNRRAVGYEISEEYCQLAVERCRQQVLL